MAVRGDDLTDVTYAGQPVLLAVRAVVRDAVWNTLPATVLGRSGHGDALTLALRFAGFGAELEGELSLDATDGRLTVRLDLEARRAFERARIGLVVLHPAAVAGTPLEVTRPDGSATRAAFPTAVAPHQPAVEIAGLTWHTGGFACALRLEGDTFEMEDQRNWTDASFKTYSTPLTLPYPVRVEAGERIRQSLTLTCTSAPTAPPTRPTGRTAEPGRVRLVDSGRRVPAIGVGASTAPGRGPGVVAPAAAHLLVELDAASVTWPAALQRAQEEAAGRPLDVKVVADGPDDVTRVVRALDPKSLVRLTTHSARTQMTEPDLWAALLDAADRAGIDRGRLYGGARSDFTELNRHHARLPGDLPALCFSMTPQVHATDERQIVASVAMQRLVTAQAVKLAAGRPVHVGPVTLRPRYNPSVASRPDAAADLSQGYGAHLVPMATDPRQTSPAAAAWLLASAAAVAAGGAASITYAETWGPRGVVDRDGSAFPVSASLGDLTGMQSQRLLVPDDDGAPDDVWVLGARSKAGVRVLAANLTPYEATLRVEVGSASVRLPLMAFGTAHTHLGEGST
ncbi:MAG: hypothetical protein ABIW80_09925 [Lapillicoccus sp.]